jgi:hypothetical protein
MDQSTQANLHQADLHHIIAKSSCASTSTLVSTHPRLLLVIDRAGLSSPTSFVVIIADNHLHHHYRKIVAAATTHGHRQRQQTTLLLLLVTPRNYKQKIRV